MCKRITLQYDRYCLERANSLKENMQGQFYFQQHSKNYANRCFIDVCRFSGTTKKGEKKYNYKFANL